MILSCETLCLCFQGAQVANSESERSLSQEDTEENGDNDSVSDTSSASAPGPSTTNVCQEFSTPVAPKKARVGKRKISDEISAVDSSLAAMAQFFKARTSAVSQPPPSPDEDNIFGTMIATELKKIQDPSIKRKLKKDIYNAVYDAQSADLEQQSQSANAQYYVVQADGALTLTEMPPSK